MMKKNKENTNVKKWGAVATLAALLVIIAFTFLMSYVTTQTGYYPMEMNDFLANASRTRFMLDFWPHINWNHEWGAGMPFFLWYAPFPFFFVMIFAKILSNTEMALAVLTVLSFAFMGAGVYGIVYETTRKRLLGVFCAFLSISLPAYWYRVVVGTVPRMISTALMMVSLWLLIKFLRNYDENNRQISKKLFIPLIISLSLSFQNHIFIAAITGFFIFVIIFIVVKGFKEKIIMFLKILAIPLLLSFYFLFPFFVTVSQTILLGKQSIGIYHADPAIPSLYLYHDPAKLVMHGGGLSPLVLPFIGIFLLIVLFGRLTRGDSFGKRIIVSFFVLTIAFVLFGTAIYLGYPANWYSVNFVPDEGFYFLALVTPVLWGVLFYYIFGRKKYLYYPTLVVFFALLAIFIRWQYPHNNEFALYDKEYYPVSKENIAISPIQKMLENDLNELNYRFAHPATEFGYFFNYAWRVPETRDFFAQGNLHPDWRAWLENAIWEWEDNYDEVNFLMDWYGIKWFVVSRPIDLLENKKKFEARPDLYQSVVKVEGETAKILTSGIYGGFEGFVFKEAYPILAASQSPSLLVVGAKDFNKSYDPVIRDLALLNINSQILIPVRGKEFIDDYNLDELSNFDSIILYQYKIKNIDKAEALLHDYVEKGGGLIIEASDFVDISLKSELAEKIMGVGIREVSINSDWQFQAEKSAITSGIDFNKFSPALYLNSPWKVNVAKTTTDQVDNILLTNGEPAVMAKNLGSGRVIFSGLNLPYHIRNNNTLNLEETRFLVNMYKWVLNTDLKKAAPAKYETKFINPEKREVLLSGDANGVVFKENYFGNWHAYLKQGSQKTNLTIYSAGPDFMYVSLPDFTPGATLFLQYRKSALENISLCITIFIGLGFVVYMLEGWLFRPILPKIKKLTLGKFSKKTKKWWDKDEDE